MHSHQFDNSSKLRGSIDVLEGRNAIQRDLERFENAGCVNHMKLNRVKIKVLHLGKAIPKTNTD